MSQWAACVVGVAAALVAPRWARADLPLGVVAEQPQSGRWVEADGVYLVSYAQRIPGTDVSIQMVPVPGGQLLLGSPPAESGRDDDEGPQRRIMLPPFWVAARETSWAEYRPYMDLCAVFEQFDDRGVRPVTEENRVDAITAPSKLYEPSFTFAAGEDPELPAVSMTQYAAKQYTKWLSLLTGVCYRLPTEAEWEHSCRAGAATAYSYGESPDQLGAFAWFDENSDEAIHPVGAKAPNRWGIYDMHGNAREWVLDAYDESAYGALPDRVLTRDEAVRRPTKTHPRVLRGGSALVDAAACRSAARQGADDEVLKMYDPNTPTSPWWLASDEAQDIGFRIVRPYPPPPEAQRSRFWDADVPQIQTIVDFRIDEEGKGERGIVDPELPKAILELKSGPPRPSRNDVGE